MRRVPYYQQRQVTSDNWRYPGTYGGTPEHPTPEDVRVEYTGNTPDDYAYIDEYRGYPYDLANLDKSIDLMDGGDPDNYDLMS